MSCEEKVEKMYVDLYVGKSKEDPSFNSRLMLVEDAIERFGKNSSKIVFLLAALLCTMIGDLVMHAVK